MVAGSAAGGRDVGCGDVCGGGEVWCCWGTDGGRSGGNGAAGCVNNGGGLCSVDSCDRDMPQAVGGVPESSEGKVAVVQKKGERAGEDYGAAAVH